MVQDVYRLCSKLPRSEDFALSSQLKRAAISICANIAEAFGRNHSKDKINFYIYSRGSAFEVRNHIIVVIVGKNPQFFSEADIEPIDIVCKQIINSLNKIVKGLIASASNPLPQPKPSTSQ